MEAARLHGLAMRITGDPDLAADAVHDTFVQVWKHADKFKPELGTAGSWLTGIVRYRALDIRQGRAREWLRSDLPDKEDDAPDALACLIETAEAEALSRCLALLEPKRRQMIISAYVDGLTQIEIARKYGVPIGTVKCWIRRALAQLKHALKP